MIVENEGCNTWLISPQSYSWLLSVLCMLVLVECTLYSSIPSCSGTPLNRHPSAIVPNNLQIFYCCCLLSYLIHTNKGAGYNQKWLCIVEDVETTISSSSVLKPGIYTLPTKICSTTSSSHFILFWVLIIIVPTSSLPFSVSSPAHQWPC